MKYVAPVAELSVLDTEDVVLISNIKVETSGELDKIDWGTI